MTSPPRPQSLLQHPLSAFALCTLLAFAVYLPALGNAFYNDDAIFLNHAARVLAHPSALFTERPLGYYRPVWCLLVTIERAAFGLQPRGYYAVGILLHALTGFLVWKLALRAGRSAFAAYAAAAAFLVFFSHSEATLWIAAHNSTLVCLLALGAVLAHVKAVETGRWQHAALTALLVLAALLAKEPGIVVLAWIPAAEVILFGFRSCFRRRALVRYAILAAGGVAFLLLNPRFLADAFVDPALKATRELRATGSFVTVPRVLGATAWLYSPIQHHAEALRPWIGAVILVAGPLLVAGLRRALLPAAFLGVALLLLAMPPTCSTLMQQMNSSRLYYFPTAGAALLAGSVAAALAGAPRPEGGLTLRAGLVAALFAAACGIHAAAIRDLNARDYALISWAQTRQAQELKPFLQAQDARGGKPLYLIEPWLDNIMHAQQFLELFCGVPAARVHPLRMTREQCAQWLPRQKRDLDVTVLDWDDARGWVEAREVPDARNSAQGTPRAARTGVVVPTVDLLSISP